MDRLRAQFTGRQRAGACEKSVTLLCHVSNQSIFQAEFLLSRNPEPYGFRGFDGLRLTGGMGFEYRFFYAIEARTGDIKDDIELIKEILKRKLLSNKEVISARNLSEVGLYLLRSGWNREA
eukprot:930515-Amorphochlora_amoeboformis.AAC.1